jgi:hypothetical protein
MSFHTVFLLALAFVVFIVGPVALVWTFIDGMRRKASDRPAGGGGISSAVGAAMLELDRIYARPSIEHQIEAENRVQDDQSDDGE